MKPEAVIVEGPLAHRMHRLAAARESATGRQILTLPLLAARLAGGFIEPAGRDLLYPAIRQALSGGGFETLSRVAALPGTPRAVLTSLNAWWRADLAFDSPNESARVRDLQLIERRVREGLPAGRLAPPDLRDAALARMHLASRFITSLRIEGVVDVPALWQPLLQKLCEIIPVSWTATFFSDRSWFPGATITVAPRPSAIAQAEVCADPRAEVIEALRWARRLLASGTVNANQIGIAVTAPDAWDDHFRVLAAEAELPLHFSHGVPALGTREGQTCAALADILLKGISQERLRRLLRRLPRSAIGERLPLDWATGLPRGAALLSTATWQHALGNARASRKDGSLAEDVLLPLIELLTKGPAVAVEAGALLLSGQTLSLWEEALRTAPAHAIDLSLRDLRVTDGRDPGNSIVWAPAAHLAAAPRSHTRLLGLTARSWPRAEEDDPLLPDHILSRRLLHPTSVTERDRRDFAILAEQSDHLILSRSQRGAIGTLQAASALWPGDTVIHGRTRIPEHAYSESDRLFARPNEAVRLPRVRTALACWNDWALDDVQTRHDGLIRASHPALEAGLADLQSTTSLQRLLCDPLGFVWQYALGWHPLRLELEPLALDRRAFGELVHALIGGTVAAFSGKGGIIHASRAEIEVALREQADFLDASWPMSRAVPPRLLWRNTLEEGVRRAARGLAEKEAGGGGKHSWSEILFGDSVPDGLSGGFPWDVEASVLLEESGLRFGGRIDRLDLSETGDEVTITDYKIGSAPAKAASIVFGHGEELQRVLYAHATRTLLPAARRIVSQLVYLGDDPASAHPLTNERLERAMDSAIEYAGAGASIIRAGQIAPGQERPFFDQLSLALPADQDSYRARKRRPFARANAPLAKLWGSA